jgi:ketosteroid isomerase-like protein
MCSVRCHKKNFERIMLRTMTTHNHCAKLSLTAIAIFLVAVQIVPLAISLSAQSSKPTPCSAPEYHKFDFWAGDWDSFDFGAAAKNAHLRVDRILDGCVLREEYQGADGRQGQSFTIYDASRKLWHQTWVTNRGELLVIEGKFEAGQMVLSGSDLTSTGQPRRVRGIWKPVERGVRETAVTSFDGGNTWKPWFDLIFRPHSSDSPAVSQNSLNDDAKAVIALDAQFQAATKANDAATIDRLLPADYILVTNSGKTFTKADLLEEARNAKRHYEHQEDTEQTVRVWGDTAVITAKLWAKGTESNKPFDYTLWFSDTYVRTPQGWRYTFAQASAPLPKTP